MSKERTTCARRKQTVIPLCYTDCGTKGSLFFLLSAAFYNALIELICFLKKNQAVDGLIFKQMGAALRALALKKYFEAVRGPDQSTQHKSKV